MRSTTKDQSDDPLHRKQTLYQGEQRTRSTKENKERALPRRTKNTVYQGEQRTRSTKENKERALPRRTKNTLYQGEQRTGSHLLVDDVVHVEGLHDVGDELGVDVGVADLVVQQLPHRAQVLGADLLGLVADVQHRRLACSITTQHSVR